MTDQNTKASGREVELKYLLEKAEPPRLPTGWTIAGGPTYLSLRDEYLDSTGRLAAMGLHLRRRTAADGGVVYTLKTAREVHKGPEALHDRREVEAATIEGSAIAQEIRRAAEASRVEGVALESLLPHLLLAQERAAWRLAHKGALCATLTVDQVRAERHGVVARWIELEIEFDASDTTALQQATALDAELRSQPGVAVSTLSKPDRAELLLRGASAGSPSPD